MFYAKLDDIQSMPRNIDEEFIQGALLIYEKMREHFDIDNYNRLVKALFEKINRTPLEKMINFDDLNYALYDLVTTLDLHPINLRLREISEDEFVTQLKSRLLTTKVFEYYIPVYFLYELPKDMSIGFSTVVSFQDLPENVQKYYLKEWEQNFEKNKDFPSLDESIKEKSESIFLHFSFKVNGENKARTESEQIAQDSLTIIGFACGGVNFNLIDFFYTVNSCEEVHSGFNGRYELPFESTIGSKEIIQRTNILTAIFVNSNPNEIELKIRNALRIYRLQQPVADDQVRFLLLVTCLESLLMTKSDRDYILWRLAEKVTFILSETERDVSMQETNSFIKEAYNKRSAFVHGSANIDEIITFSDTVRLDVFIYKLVWSIINNFLGKGYTKIQKTKDKKSIDEYIEQRKFGEKPVGKKE